MRLKASIIYCTKNKNRKNEEEKLKIKTEMLRRNSLVKSPWNQSLGRKRIYGGKDV